MQRRRKGGETIMQRIFWIRTGLKVGALLAGWIACGLSVPVAAYGSGDQEILVKLRETATSADLQRLSSQEGVEVVKENAVLGYVKLHSSEPGFSVSEAVARLSGDRSVEWAEPNGSYGLSQCPRAPVDPMLVDLPDGAPENQWGVFKTQLFDLWRYNYGGDPAIVIAIVDTGIDDFTDPHPDLADNVLPTGYDTVQDDADPSDLGSGAFSGHGTHVAGIAAASANDEGVVGVAYCSDLLIVRAMDCTAGDECPGTYENIADGIQLAADYGVHVINLSLGGTEPSNAIRTAIHYAIDSGAIVVAASGNDTAATLNYPAKYPEVIAVGATDSSDDVASFSNWGDELDIVAPGVDVYSTFKGDTYVKRSGTSMAAPFVSGLAALVISENFAITQLEMETYLREHAIPLDGANAARDGFGRIQFLPLIDWSDAPPPYDPASHTNFAWEWLGDEASPELGLADPIDGDHRPNIGGPGAADGYDDGIFRESVFTLPILPPHLGEGGESYDALLGVANPSAPRYGDAAAKRLHLDIWSDWDGDGDFETGAAEYSVEDATFNPATWVGDRFLANQPFTPVDEHIWGNPLVVRSRVMYGASAGSPAGASPYGEVEDDILINFVEDFDVTSRVHVPGVYVTLGEWDLAPDPTPWCGNHGTGWVAATAHPEVGEPCNEVLEAVTTLAGPDMDWTEYTSAFIRLWYCHELFDDRCSSIGDECRIRVDKNGTKIDLGPIPLGSGTLLFDVSDLVGGDVTRVEIVEETDLPGHVSIDDLVIWAFDGEDPLPVTDLALTRTPGSQTLGVSLSSPRENLFIPSPPADGEANIYDLRYSEDPIVDDGSWLSARPVRPMDLIGAAPTPGAPGTLSSGSFKAPSAFAAYSVAVRTLDETTNVSALSNSPAVANMPTLGVTVVGQGEEAGEPSEIVTVDFRVTNTGNIADQYSITATDTRAYEFLDLPGLVSLDPATSSIYALRVRISPGAVDAEIDTVTVTATSLSSGVVTGSGAERIVVDGSASDVNPGSEAVIASALRMTGRHPFSDRLDLAVDLAARGRAQVAIYDTQGRRVRSLLDQELPAGSHSLQWDATDDQGREVPSGTFFLLARATAWSERRAIVFVR